MPRIACPDEFGVDVLIPDIYPGHSPAIFIPIHSADADLFTEKQGTGDLPRRLAERLRFFGTIDSIQSDFFLCVVGMQNGNGISIGNPDDFGRFRAIIACGKKKKQGQYEKTEPATVEKRGHGTARLCSGLRRYKQHFFRFYSTGKSVKFQFVQALMVQGHTTMDWKIV